jgi:nucleotidyltransferase/DNA polymerase involved in DNA repair
LDCVAVLHRNSYPIAQTIAALAKQVGDDLRQRGYRGRTVGIKLRFADFKTVTRDRTVSVALDDGAAIRRLAFECLARIDMKRPVRLVGVRVGELSPAAASSATDPAHGAVQSVRVGDSLPLFVDEAQTVQHRQP